MANYIIKDTCIVNEKKIIYGDVLLSNGRITKVGGVIESNSAIEILGKDKYLLPGIIDDQVHFREPGFEHKGTILTESRAAVAGGVTSFMEMPNTKPQALTQELLEQKYDIASKTSLANYSFYMGVSNDNYEEAMRTNNKKDRVCGLKVFMGSSTGNLLVDNPLSLYKVFSGSELLIATHCEEEPLMQQNLQKILNEKGFIEPADHPLIRDEAVCFESSLKAVQLAMRHGTRLHILHISTEKELQLFSNMLPLEEKKITAEVCVHHLHFTSNDYASLGNLIKCNPAIKAPNNRDALWKALLDNRLDVIATDHAPHTLSEKTGSYLNAHAGLPLVQHSLQMMLENVEQGKISLETVVDKMSHAVAICFNVKDRGFIREGYFADLVLVEKRKAGKVYKSNILYNCAWSPLEGIEFSHQITHTFVNGNLIFQNGSFTADHTGMRLEFDRD